MIGFPELLLIIAIVLILFGPKLVTGLGGTFKKTGKAYKSGFEGAVPDPQEYGDDEDECIEVDAEYEDVAAPALPEGASEASGQSERKQAPPESNHQSTQKRKKTSESSEAPAAGTVAAVQGDRSKRNGKGRKSKGASKAKVIVMLIGVVLAIACIIVIVQGKM